MPYIPQTRRNKGSPDTSGELNYQLTAVICEYLGRKGLCYMTINDILGALEGAKLEFYRRIAAPYEDKKIEENGDVYPVVGTPVGPSGAKVKPSPYDTGGDW